MATESCFHSTTAPHTTEHTVSDIRFEISEVARMFLKMKPSSRSDYDITPILFRNITAYRLQHFTEICCICISVENIFRLFALQNVFNTRPSN